MARRILGVVAGLAAWVAIVIVAGMIMRAAWREYASVLLLLVVFIPQHIMLWDKFPVWYPLTFLVSLVPLTYMGGNITAPR
jgi:hypothetical protein